MIFKSRPYLMGPEMIRSLQMWVVVLGGGCRHRMPPGALTSLRSGNWTSLNRAWAGEQSRGMGRGPSGEKSPAFPRLSTPSFHPAPLLRAESSTGPQEGEGPGGLAAARRIGLCGPVAGRGAQAEGRGPDPQVHCPAGPSLLSPGSPKRSQRVPPPAAPTSPCGAQGPDVESSPRPARLSTTPPSAASLRPGLDSTRVVPAAWRARGSPCACKRRVASLRRSSGCGRSCRSRRAAGAAGAGARPGSMPAQPR